MMESLILSLALSVVISAIKNPAKKDKLKSVLLNLRNAISTAYPGE